MEERFLSEISILPGQINVASCWEMAWISCCSDYIYFACSLCARLLHRVLRIRDLCLESADRFLSPQVDPEMEGMDGASLPTQGLDEFKPFIRRLPEFKFWFLLIPSPFSFVCHAFSFSAILL